MITFLRSILRPRGVRIAVCLVLALAIAHFALLLLAQRTLDAVRAQAASAGMRIRPGSHADHIPGADNAANAYAKAMVLLTADSGWPYDGTSSGGIAEPFHEMTDALIAKPFGTWTASDREAARKVLDGAEFQRIASYLHDGAQAHQCAFALDWQAGPAMRLPMLSVLRTLARMLLCRAELELEQGRSEQAVDDLDDALAIATHLSRTTLIIGNLVAFSIVSQGITVLDAMLMDGPISGAGRARLAARLESFDPWMRMADAVEDETLLLEPCFDDSTQIGALGWYRSWPMRPLCVYDHAVYDAILTQAWQSLRARRPIAQDPEVPSMCRMTRMLMPAIATLSRSVARSELEREAALTALALEDWRQRHGSCPVGLDALGLASVASGNHAFHYQQTGAGWSLRVEGLPESRAARAVRERDPTQGGMLWRSPPAP